MQPNALRKRQAGVFGTRAVTRVAMASLLALAAGTVPIWQVASCSCAGGDLPGAIRAATVAFVGTAEASAEAPPTELGPRTRYAFSVERASRQTGGTIEILAWSGGDAGCGVTFGIGERYVVIAHSQNGDLETNLCNGNVPVDGLPPAQQADLDALLPIVPERTAVPKDDHPFGAVSGALPAFVLVAALLVLVGASWLTLRRR